jgi:mono/diheme cytochrome c family protein
MFSNGVRVSYVPRINEQGYLKNSEWIWNGATTNYSRGEAIFRGECGSCHTLSGYRPMRSLMAGRDRTNIGNFVTMLHDYKPDSPYRRFMPPMVGSQQDIVDLTDYLNAQVNGPAGDKVLTARK